MYQGKKFIYCADAGIGSYNIRKFNSMGGRAFIITQSIKKLSKQLKAAVFNDYDYRRLSDNSGFTLEEMSGFSLDILKSEDKDDLTSTEYKDKRDLYDDFLYKEIYAGKNLDLPLLEEQKLKNGKTRMVKSKGLLPQKIIITFSRKHQEYQRRIRNAQIARAEAIIQSGRGGKSKKGPNDVRRFIKQDKSTGREKYLIDEDRIREEEKYDGFYAIATNLDDDPKEILAINKNRYKIEECFRILKTTFKSRPIEHYTPPRIRAHFLICYTALLIFRLLEKKLENYGSNHTTNQILETLKNIKVVEQNNLFYQSIYDASECLNSLNATSKLDLDKTNYKKDGLDKLAKKLKR